MVNMKKGETREERESKGEYVMGNWKMKRGEYKGDRERVKNTGIKGREGF